MIYQFIGQNKPKSLSFKKACYFFSVSSSGFFKNRKVRQQFRQEREKEVVFSFKSYGGRYGYRKVAHYVNKARGIACSPAQARRCLNTLGLKARKVRAFKPQTTQSAHSLSVVQRVFKTEETVLTCINQVWGSDITYLKAQGRNFLYLVVFLDFYSRKIVGWELSHTLSSGFVLRAFEKALKVYAPEPGLVVHSDRGVQYASKIFRQKLKNLGFIQSMSRKGNCYDNAYCESCFSLLKRELGSKVYQNMIEAKQDIFKWIEGWYNTHRLHSALGYKSPLEFEKMLQCNKTKTS